jgi:hypothetical protein
MPGQTTSKEIYSQRRVPMFEPAIDSAQPRPSPGQRFATNRLTCNLVNTVNVRPDGELPGAFRGGTIGSQWPVLASPAHLVSKPDFLFATVVPEGWGHPA